MRAKAVSIVAAFMFGLLLAAQPAQACPSGQHRGMFGWCYPNVGGVVGQTAEAVKKGDWNTVAKGVGDIVITYQCLGCAVFAQALMDPNDRAIISTIVGRGVILQALGVPPTLVLADAATGVATAVKLIGQSPTPMPAPQTPQRGKKIYRSATLAACIVEGQEGMATIGWTTAPVFIEKTSGVSSTFPVIDLKTGDIVSSMASECPEYAKLQGQKSLTDIAILYENSQTVPGPAEQMKYFIMGRKTDLTIVAADK